MAHADIVVTPSAATACDAARFGRVAPGRLRVVPWGVDRAVFRPLRAAQIATVLARLGVESPYLLSLDVFNPRKNFAAVLEAVARLPGGTGRPRKTASTAAFQAQSVSLGLRARLRVLDDVGTEDLVALYCGALAFVYPGGHGLRRARGVRERRVAARSGRRRRAALPARRGRRARRGALPPARRSRIGPATTVQYWTGVDKRYLPEGLVWAEAPQPQVRRYAVSSREHITSQFGAGTCP